MNEVPDAMADLSAFPETHIQLNRLRVHFAYPRGKGCTRTLQRT